MPLKGLTWNAPVTLESKHLTIAHRMGGILLCQRNRKWWKYCQKACQGCQLVFFIQMVSSVNLQCKFVAAAPGAQNANFVKHKQKCTSRRFNFKNPRKLRSKFSSLKCLKHCQRHKKPGLLYISMTTSTLTPKLNSNDHLNQHKSWHQHHYQQKAALSFDSCYKRFNLTDWKAILLKKKI